VVYCAHLRAAVVCGWVVAVAACRVGYEPIETRRATSGVTVDAATAGAGGSENEAGSGGGDVDAGSGGAPDDAGSGGGPDDAGSGGAPDDATADEAPLDAASPDVAEDADAAPSDLVVDFSDPAQMVRNGSATIDGSALDLTTGAQVQAGSAYLPTPYAIGPSTVFSIFFTFRMYGGDGAAGADGITLIWQNAPAGTAALGLPGSGVGYETVTPSVDVRFRTARTTAEDPGDNYVAINEDGTRAAVVANTTLPFDLNDGVSHNVWVDYDGATKTITVYLDDAATKPAVPALTGVADLQALVGATAYLGFTGSTGGATNVQAIEAMTVHYRY